MFVGFIVGNANAVEMTLVVLLACFVLLPCFSLCSLIFRSPPTLCRHLLSRRRVVLSVQQLYVPPQNVCCSSCGISDIVASHSSQLLSFSFVFFLLIFLRFWSGLFCVLVPGTLVFHLP